MARESKAACLARALLANANGRFIPQCLPFDVDDDYDPRYATDKKRNPKPHHQKDSKSYDHIHNYTCTEGTFDFANFDLLRYTTVIYCTLCKCRKKDMGIDPEE